MANDNCFKMEQDLLTMCEVKIMTHSEGNPGAILAMAEVVKNYSKIDPKAFLGPLHFFDFLETFEMKSSVIWFLYKDICGQKTHNVVAVTRGHQLGLLPVEKIKLIAGQHFVNIDFDSLIKDIKSKIEFNTETIEN